MYAFMYTCIYRNAPCTDITGLLLSSIVFAGIEITVSQIFGK